MAFIKNKFRQMNLFYKTYTLTERGEKFLKRSWANVFAEHVFPHINEERFSVLYSDNIASRPNTPVNIIIGMEILKKLHSLSDYEVLEAVILDYRYQHALRTAGIGEQPVSDRTLSRFRARLSEYELATGRNLMREEIEELSGQLAKMKKITGYMKRLGNLTF